MLYRHTKIWIYSLSQRCVIGFDPDQINEIIKKYNSPTHQIYKYSDFWSFFNYETGEDVKGFDCIWNDGNPLIKKLVKIKKQIGGF